MAFYTMSGRLSLDCKCETNLLSSLTSTSCSCILAPHPCCSVADEEASDRSPSSIVRQKRSKFASALPSPPPVLATSSRSWGNIPTHILPRLSQAYSARFLSTSRHLRTAHDDWEKDQDRAASTGAPGTRSAEGLALDGLTPREVTSKIRAALHRYSARTKALRGRDERLLTEQELWKLKPSENDHLLRSDLAASEYRPESVYDSAGPSIGPASLLHKMHGYQRRLEEEKTRKQSLKTAQQERENEWAAFAQELESQGGRGASMLRSRRRDWFQKRKKIMDHEELVRKLYEAGDDGTAEFHEARRSLEKLRLEIEKEMDELVTNRLAREAGEIRGGTVAEQARELKKSSAVAERQRAINAMVREMQNAPVTSRQRGRRLRQIIRKETTKPTEPAVQLTPVHRKEVEKQKASMRRAQQRLAKHEANLARLEEGRWKVNEAVEARMRPLPARSLTSTSPRFAEADAWADDGFMPQPSTLNIQTRSLGNVQKLALEKALAGTTDGGLMIVPKQRNNDMSGALRARRLKASAAEKAIAKFVDAKKKRMASRSENVRYVGANGLYSAVDRQKRGLHTCSITSRKAMISGAGLRLFTKAAVLKPWSLVRSYHTETETLHQGAQVLVNTDEELVDSDVLYQAFEHLMQAPLLSDEALSTPSRGKKLQRQAWWTKRPDLLKESYAQRLSLLEARCNPAFEVWYRLAPWWRQEVWQAAVGMRNEDLERLKRRGISRYVLRYTMADLRQRQSEGSPRIRDDSMFDRIINSETHLTNEDLRALGIGRHARTAWMALQLQLSPPSPVSTSLGQTKLSIRHFARRNKHLNLVAEQRTKAALTHATRALDNWKLDAERVQKELWLILMGVSPSDSAMRFKTSGIAVEMSDVKAALTEWTEARDKGLQKPFANSKSFLLHRREKLWSPELKERGLLAKRRQALRRADLRAFGGDVDMSAIALPPDEGLIGTPSIPAPDRPYLPFGEYRGARRLVAMEKVIDKLPYAVDKFREELFCIFTDHKPARTDSLTLESSGDTATHDYISWASLRRAMKLFNLRQGKVSTKTMAAQAAFHMTAVRNGIRDRDSNKRDGPAAEVKKITIRKHAAVGAPPDEPQEPLALTTRKIPLSGHENTEDSDGSQSVLVVGNHQQRDLRAAQAKLMGSHHLPLSSDTTSTENGGHNDVQNPAPLTVCLRRLNRGKRRYERFLAANLQIDQDEDILEDLFELPHEATMGTSAPSSMFKPSQSRSAPLRRIPDDDDDKFLVAQQPSKRSAPKLTHLNASGEAQMVSVASKANTKRTAIATGKVRFSAWETYEMVTTAALKKGDVLALSRIAGIQAAKMCPSIVPLCHPIMISSVTVDVLPYSTAEECGICINGTVECTGPTGVEMEALTAVMGAALTVIDMVKAVDKAASIEGVKVVYKAGGKSGTWVDAEWQGTRKNL